MSKHVVTKTRDLQKGVQALPKEIFMNEDQHFSQENSK